MFHTVLIANRGEIACRVIGTLRKLGIRSVAVYSDADAGARHVALADLAVRLGAAMSYLDIATIIEAARATGAHAIHPGYGFHAENAAFADACAEAEIVFIGPGTEALSIMGDKIRAKTQVQSRGVPVVPGIAEPGLTDEQLAAAAPEIGFPVLIKPSAGGGGTGMHLVREPSELAFALATARREATASFGDDTLLLERFVPNPRHIEVQILADQHGTTVHLGERECSLQRRHQKVIEEAPSVLLDDATRARIGQAAVDTATSVAYRGAGTVEFIVSADAPGEFFFMEMNTRLQVEHPVTELVTGRDIVEWQLRIAAGEALDFGQDDIRLTGHAVEARIYAEDPRNGFLPSSGRVAALVQPAGEGIRVDSALIDGLVVSPDYDPLLAKVIAWGADRATAMRRLHAALSDTVTLGVTNNVEFLKLLLADPDVVAGRLDTGLIDRRIDDLAFRPADHEILVSAALILHALAVDSETPLWGSRTGWRLGGARPTRYLLRAEGATTPVEVAGRPLDAVVTIGGSSRRASARLTSEGARVVLDGVSRSFVFSRHGDRLFLAHEGASWTIDEVGFERAAGATGSTDPELRSPMPGVVAAVHVNDGAIVEAGAAVVSIEAMKMEHVLRATARGTVALRVVVGAHVAGDEIVATIAGSDQDSTPDEKATREKAPDEKETVR